jgi:hypothetical protein
MAVTSATKEFWGSVMFYDEAFRAFETENEKKALFRGRYSRFAPVVRKYDNLKGYSGMYTQRKRVRNTQPAARLLFLCVHHKHTNIPKKNHLVWIKTTKLYFYFLFYHWSCVEI